MRVDRTELLDNLNTYGQHLVVSKDASAADLATGMGMALLALTELLKAGSPAAEQAGPSVDGGHAFKAKATRW